MDRQLVKFILITRIILSVIRTIFVLEVVRISYNVCLHLLIVYDNDEERGVVLLLLLTGTLFASYPKEARSRRSS